jgi:hypothetical protein
VRKFIKKHTEGWLPWAIVLTLMVCPLSIAMTWLVLHEADASKKYVPDLRKIAEQTPLCPGLQKTGEKVVLKQHTAYFFTWYKSDVPFADIQAFYSRELPAQGWTPPQPPSSSWIETDPHRGSYRRGDYFIDVEQDDREPDSFGIVFIWDPQ